MSESIFSLSDGSIIKFSDSPENTMQNGTIEITKNHKKILLKFEDGKITKIIDELSDKLNNLTFINEKLNGLNFIFNKELKFENGNPQK